MTKAFPIAITALLFIGCAHIQTLNPWRQSDYDKALHSAQQAADAGNYFVAERLFDEFVRTHPDTREAREIGFWKSVYLIDPSNDHGSLSAGITGLDGYLSANPEGWYRNEAIVLRRTAAVAQGVASRELAASDSSAATVVRDTIVVGSKSRDEQIASLKDQLAQSKAELAKVSAELDRIKKRLANPSN